jgi:hypothetical protein
MANPHKGELSFEADGKTYTLVYSNNALVELEDKLNRGIVDLTTEMSLWAQDPTKIRLGLLRAVFWAAFIEHHPEVDLKAAGELITKVGGVAEVTSLVGEAFARAFPDPETKDTHPPKASPIAKRVGTGRHSLNNTSASN